MYRRRRLAVLLGLAAVAGGIGVGAYFLVDALKGSETQRPPAPAPAPAVVVQKQQQPQAAQDLGFPAFATKNTTRVAGADPVADAAGVALAVFPAVGTEGPPAVTVVADGDWQSGIAAAVLTAPPIGAPVLITGTSGVPGLTTDALAALAPAGSAATGGSQIFRIGSASAPAGLQTQRVPGKTPAAIAAGIAQLRQKLVGMKPAHVLLASSTDAASAMPAAAWAARSGDPVLFVRGDTVPKATMGELSALKGVPVYALGSPAAVSDKALKTVERIAPNVRRTGASDPVENAIDFARYADGTFGWDINDPGHGFVVANDSRPLDAAAAAPLSASGDWGPLLVTSGGGQVPDPLRTYLLDLKPGYIDDPTRAVYNHVWLIGDQSAISVAFQAQIDDLAEVAKVRSATGATAAPPPASALKPPPKRGGSTKKP